MKTSFPKPSATPTWYILDAQGKILGRMATTVARSLMGKHHATYVPQWVNAPHIVIINAEKVVLTGTKGDEKKYHRHTGYFGHLKQTTTKRLRAEDPAEIILHAVKGMLPKNLTREKLLLHLHITAGAEHKHEANKPVPFPF